MGRTGFTLIELVVVMTIIAIVGAVVLPPLWPARPAESEWIAGYGGLVRRARDQALDRGETVALSLDPATGEWRITVGASAPQGGDALATGRLAPPEGCSLTAARGSWVVTRFDPLGRAAGDPLQVCLGPATRHVRVDPWTADLDALPE